MIDLSKTEDEEQQPLIDLTASNTIGPAPLPKGKLEERSIKYAIALGEGSPDLDRIQAMLSSPGGEDIIRDTAVEQSIAERRKAAEALLASGEDVPLPDLEAAVEASRRPVERQIALEKRFTERVFAGSLASTENPDEVGAGAATEVAQRAQDFFIDNMTRIEALRKLREDRDAKVQATRSWGQFIGESVTQMIPFWTESSQSSEALGENLPAVDRYIPGKNKQEQYAYIHSLPAAEAVALTNQILSEMDSVQGDTWLSGLVDGYSDSEAALDNIFFGLDAMGILPAGMLRKAGTKAGRTLSAGARLKKAEEKTVEYVARKEALNSVPGARDLKPTDARAKWLSPSPEVEVATPTVNRLVRTAAAVMQPEAKVDNILAGMGKMEEASHVRGLELAREWISKAPKTSQEGVASLIERTPSLTNPKSWDISLSNGHIERSIDIATILQRNIELAGKAFSGVMNVQRIPSEIEQLALQTAEDQLKLEARQRGFEKAFIGVVQKYASKDTGLNIASVEAKLGYKNGKLFQSADVAKAYADKRYNLIEGTYSVTQEGDGYAITVRKDIDETSSSVREALMKVDLGNEEKNKILGIVPVPKSVTGAKESFGAFSNQQRETLVHAQTALRAYAQAMLEPVSRLSKREQKDLEKIMRINRNASRTPGDPNSRGMFYNNLSEFEDAYVTHLHRLPTDEEALAYATFVQQSDLDYIFRSTSLMKTKSRMGVERLQAVVGDKKLDFEGKVIDKLPFYSPNDANVYLAVGKGKMVRLNEAGFSDEFIKQQKEKNWTITQVYDPEAETLRKSLGVSGPVHFIVTPSIKKGALRFDEQLSYRPGFHVRYKDNNFIKQGRITRDSTGRLLYSGDSSVLGVSNEVKGAKETALLERAREAYNAKRYDDLDQIIKDGLPVPKKEIVENFKSGKWDTKTPFMLVKNGQSTADPLAKTLSGKSLKDLYGEFHDLHNSPHNLSRQADVEYIGSKDGPLWSIKEEGTEENPMYRMEEARTVDVMQTQQEAMNRLIHDRHFQDYQIQAAESFVAEFGDLLESPTMSREYLRRNPVAALMNAEVNKKALGKRYDAAKTQQLAIQNLLYTKRPMSKYIAHVQARLLSEAYKRSGEKYIDVVDNMSAALSTNLVGKLRGMAFHMKLGMFNIQQVPLQLNTLTAMTAIAPKHAMSSILMAAQMRRLDLTAGDDAIEAVAKAAAKTIPGWTKDEFIEARKLLSRTGFDIVGHEASFRNDLADEKLFKSGAATILDWGAKPFNFAERYVRISAWNTAYKEYIDKFPKLAGKLNDDDAKVILNRANDLSLNMNKASHGRWQEGSMSMMTQFWGYSMRMFDALTGLRLTKAEKARLVLMNAFMYGIPIAGSALLPIWPWDKTIRQHLMESGYAVNEGVADVMLNGAVASTISALTSLYGEEVQLDVGGRWGPASIQLLWNLTEMKQSEDAVDKIIEALGGASGSILSDVLWSGTKAIADQFYMMGTSTEKSPILQADVLDVLKNVSTFNQIERLWLAANLGIRETKDHGVIDKDYDLGEAIFHSLTGIDNQKISDSFLQFRSARQEREFNTKTSKEIKKWLNLWKRNVHTDPDAATAYRNKAKIWMDAAGMNSEQRSRMIREIMKDKTMLDTATDVFIKAPTSKDEELRRQKQLEGQ